VERRARHPILPTRLPGHPLPASPAPPVTTAHRPIRGRSERPRPALVMHKIRPGCLPACSAVVGSPTARRLLISKRRAVMAHLATGSLSRFRREDHDYLRVFLCGWQSQRSCRPTDCQMTKTDRQ
jgi:hypothetical protein